MWKSDFPCLQIPPLIVENHDVTEPNRNVPRAILSSQRPLYLTRTTNIRFVVLSVPVAFLLGAESNPEFVPRIARDQHLGTQDGMEICGVVLQCEGLNLVDIQNCRCAAVNSCVCLCMWLHAHEHMSVCVCTCVLTQH
jgi:hypothetical protein